MMPVARINYLFETFRILASAFDFRGNGVLLISSCMVLPMVLPL